MGTHGSESFFVLGEGLLGETAGGRDPTLALAPDVAAITPPFRFSRLGPKGTGKQLNETNRKKIGSLMAAGTGGPGQIPAAIWASSSTMTSPLTRPASCSAITSRRRS